MYNFNTNYSISESDIIYSPKYGITAVPLYYDNTTHLHNIDEDDGLDLYNVDSDLEVMENLIDSRFHYSFSILSDTNTVTLSEATLLQIPVDRDRDLPGMSYNDAIKKIDEVPHVDLYLIPQLDRGKDKYSSCYVWVKNPKPIDGVNYIPIIIHISGGVSVHPTYSKYFKRSFSNRERHLILGFIKLYGTSIAWRCNLAAEKGLEELPESDSKAFKRDAMNHRDSDAPKRIDQGDPRELRSYYKASVEDYERWRKMLPKS